jgi:hypothetical protein
VCQDCGESVYNATFYHTGAAIVFKDNTSGGVVFEISPPFGTFNRAEQNGANEIFLRPTANDRFGHKPAENQFSAAWIVFKSTVGCHKR